MPGVMSDWHQQLVKAPWTPMDSAFPIGWALSMLGLGVFMGIVWPRVENKSQLKYVFVSQWVLNIIWNPIFFYFHNITFGMATITVLCVMVAVLQFAFIKKAGWASLAVTPYFIWILIAASLNGYIFFYN